MTHRVIYYQARVRWLLCNNIIPKAIPLSERLAQCPNLARHINTMELVERAEHIGFDTHETVPHILGTG